MRKSNLESLDWMWIMSGPDSTTRSSLGKKKKPNRQHNPFPWWIPVRLFRYPFPIGNRILRNRRRISERMRSKVGVWALTSTYQPHSVGGLLSRCSFQVFLTSFPRRFLPFPRSLPRTFRSDLPLPSRAQSDYYFIVLDRSFPPFSSFS